MLTPAGIPTQEASNVAAVERRREREAIPVTSGSSVHNKRKAWEKLSR
jgi:hypothetical protein